MYINLPIFVHEKFIYKSCIIHHMEGENGKIEFVAKVWLRPITKNGVKYKYPTITVPKEVREYVKPYKYYKIIMIPI